MAKSTRRKKDSEEPVDITDFSIDYSGIMDSLENEFKMAQGSLDHKAKQASYMSSGLLMGDLILGGGILPGKWYGHAGKEGSAKSTRVMQIVGNAVNTDVPVINEWDYEGSSSDVVYLENMYDGQVKAKNIFGIRDEKGEWVIKPRVRYYNPSTAEEFFDSAAELLRRLPDKIYIKGKWYFAFEKTKKNASLVEGKQHKELSAKYGKLMVATKQAGMQALMLVDSWAAMFPDKLDETGKGGGLGANARMFSENIPKVRSKLARKAATILGTNQIREKPMVMFGNPEYEPGGNTLKHAADCRVQQTARSVRYGKGPFEEEPSITVENGKDVYRYIHMKTTKNKTATPYLEAWSRLWTKDAKGSGRGFDRVYDTFEYLVSTGQVEVKSMVKRSRIQIKLPTFQNKRPWEWEDFKAMVSLRGNDRKDYSKHLKLKEVPDLRSMCQAQIAKGEGTELYFNQLRKVTKEVKEED